MQRAPLPSVPEVLPPAASTPTPTRPPAPDLVEACQRTDEHLDQLTASSREAERKLRKTATSSGRFQPFKRSSG